MAVVKDTSYQLDDRESMTFNRQFCSSVGHAVMTVNFVAHGEPWKWEAVVPIVRGELERVQALVLSMP